MGGFLQEVSQGNQQSVKEFLENGQVRKTSIRKNAMQGCLTFLLNYRGKVCDLATGRTSKILFLGWPLYGVVYFQTKKLFTY